MSRTSTAFAAGGGCFGRSGGERFQPGDRGAPGGPVQGPWRGRGRTRWLGGCGRCCPGAGKGEKRGGLRPRAPCPCLGRSGGGGAFRSPGASDSGHEPHVRGATCGAGPTAAVAVVAVIAVAAVAASSGAAEPRSRVPPRHPPPRHPPPWSVAPFPAVPSPAVETERRFSGAPAARPPRPRRGLGCCTTSHSTRPRAPRTAGCTATCSWRGGGGAASGADGRNPQRRRGPGRRRWP